MHCACAGDRVSICVTSTAAAQGESGLTIWTVVAAKPHWLNVDTVPGAFMTVTMVKMCQSSVATVSSNSHHYRARRKPRSTIKRGSCDALQLKGRQTSR